MSSSPDDVTILMEMGFSETRAKKGLAKTSHAGIQQAMDWILAHSEDPDIDEPYIEQAGHVLGGACANVNKKDAESDQANENSLAQATGNEPDVIPENAAEIKDSEELVEMTKCLDCGKLLQTDDDLEIHAARLKHVNYEKVMEKMIEITPEEKKEQAERLQEILKQKRVDREEKDKKEGIQKEKKRRADGKDIAAMKQSIADKEMMKIAEQRRKDRLEDKMARQRVLDNIKRDRLEKEEANRKAKGLPPLDEPLAQPQSPPTAIAKTPSAPPKDNADCKLMLRLSNGMNLKASFSNKETLAAVRVYVMVNCDQVGDAQLSFSTAYPKRKYTEEDMQLPLLELGLVPTAVLNVTVD